MNQIGLQKHTSIIHEEEDDEDEDWDDHEDEAVPFGQPLPLSHQ